MDYIALAGRVFFAAIFIAASPRHFSREGIQHAADLGVPLAWLLVPCSGAMAFTGGLSILLGFHPRLGAWLLVAFLVPVTVMMHPFWRMTDPILAHTHRAMFFKNLSMLGAALLITRIGVGPLAGRSGL